MERYLKCKDASESTVQSLVEKYNFNNPDCQDFEFTTNSKYSENYLLMKYKKDKLTEEEKNTLMKIIINNVNFNIYDFYTTSYVLKLKDILINEYKTHDDTLEYFSLWNCIEEDTLFNISYFTRNIVQQVTYEKIFILSKFGKKYENYKNDFFCKDWERKISVKEKIELFFNLYYEKGISDDIKFCLLRIILFNLNYNFNKFKKYTSKLKKLIENDYLIHEHTLEAFSTVGDYANKKKWPISNYIKDFYYQFFEE